MNQQNKENTDEIEIDLGEIFGLLLHRLWLILLCGIACGIIGFIVSSFIVTPKYDSTTKIYILNRQNNNNLTLSDTQLASQHIFQCFSFHNALGTKNFSLLYTVFRRL